jgi:hypothetical protein
MKNSFFLFILCLFCSSSWAQSTIRGVVLDTETGAPIPFVNIGIKALSKGTVSDFNGQYELEHDQTDAEVLFSAIGYYPTAERWLTLKKEGTVRLTPKHYELQTVEVTAREWSEQDIIIGNPIDKKKQSVNFGSSQLGTAIGALLTLEQETFLKTANFFLNHAKGDSMHFRIHIHTVKDDVVGEHILMENILVSKKQQKGLLTVDLTPYNLVVSGPVLLSLEWIRDDGDRGNQGLSFRARKSSRKDNFFMKLSSVDDYVRASTIHRSMPKLELAFYFEGKQSE